LLWFFLVTPQSYITIIEEPSLSLSSIVVALYVNFTPQGVRNLTNNTFEGTPGLLFARHGPSMVMSRLIVTNGRPLLIAWMSNYRPSCDHGDFGRVPRRCGRGVPFDACQDLVIA
jgi:hypothetical protein